MAGVRHFLAAPFAVVAFMLGALFLLAFCWANFVGGNNWLLKRVAKQFG